MGALETRLADINARLAASSVEADELARLLRRRDSLLETAEEVRDRLDAATARVQQVEDASAASGALFRYAVHRRRIEAFLAPHQREGFVAAAMYLVLEHELASLNEELDDIEARARSLTGGQVRHRMLIEWRDELLMAAGPVRITAAEQALERVSAAVETAGRAKDLDTIDQAMEVALRAGDDLRAAAAALQKVGRLEKDDVAAVADLVGEGTRQFSLREAKRRVEQATLRLGFLHDELRAVEGLRVEVRHPYFAAEGFLAGLFDDFQAGQVPAEAQAAVEEAGSYVELVVHALTVARETASLKAERARAKEADTVTEAVGRLRPAAVRLTSTYSVWDAAPALRR
jgi:hypothetical protein